MKAIDTIIFDLGDVLLDLDRSRTEARFRQLLGDDFQRAWQQTEKEQIFLRYELGEFEEPDFLDALRRIAGKPLGDDELRAAWNAMLVQIPLQRVEMLQRLQRSFQVFLLSNTNATHIAWVHRHLQQEYGIRNFEEELFHRVFCSYRLRLYKPDPAIYRRVLEEAGLSPERTVFIDDLPQNVASAAELGIRAIHHPPGSEVAHIEFPTG